MPEERTYLIRCTYRPGGAQDRLAIRREHIEHMLEWLPRTVFGGALLDSAGKEPVGMVVALRMSTASIFSWIPRMSTGSSRPSRTARRASSTPSPSIR